MIRTIHGMANINSAFNTNKLANSQDI